MLLLVLLLASSVSLLILCCFSLRSSLPVADAEVIRKILHTDPTSPWDCVLGQSFGGFCLATYLTSKSGAIKDALFTGGIPPLTVEDPKEVNGSKSRRMSQATV